MIIIISVAVAARFSILINMYCIVVCSNKYVPILSYPAGDCGGFKEGKTRTTGMATSPARTPPNFW